MLRHLTVLPEGYENVRNKIQRALEEEILEKFKRRAHDFLTTSPADDHLVDWWAIMQHHGAPTRLLDWTESPYVAAYFAVESLESETDCAIWTLDRDAICRRTSTLLELANLATGGTLDRWIDDGRFARFAETLTSDPPAVNSVIPVRPFRLTERLNIQQGLFLLPLNLRRTFQENLVATCVDEGQERPAVRIHKVLIKNSLRGEFLRELNRMNVNRATLFPGLDGFARSLSATIHIIGQALAQKLTG